MSATNGNFYLAPVGDVTKESQAFVVGIPAGAGVAQVVNPTVPVDALTAYNYTTNLLRATVTFTGGIIAAGAAATRTFLIPPGATASYDWGDDHVGDTAQGAIGAIDSVSIVTVVAGTATAEASTLGLTTAAAPAVAGVAYLNFASN